MQQMGHSKRPPGIADRVRLKEVGREVREGRGRLEGLVEIPGDGSGSAAARRDGDEGGDRPASARAASGSVQNCSCSFSEFHK